MVTEERDRDDAGPPGGEWLLARARAGDEEAFSRLIDENMDYVYAIACKFVRNPSDAEDITQEVFEKLGKALKSFDGRSAFRSWLYTITLNSVRDYVRAAARRGRKHDAFGKDASETISGGQYEAVVRSELWAAVNRLPGQQREAMILVYAEDMSHAEAADVMGIREGTVSSHIHDAKKALRDLL
jgi:RNA polymerase sigma factor (sigma-70 family)